MTLPTGHLSSFKAQIIYDTDTEWTTNRGPLLLYFFQALLVWLDRMGDSIGSHDSPWVAEHRHRIVRLPI